MTVTVVFIYLKKRIILINIQKCYNTIKSLKFHILELSYIFLEAEVALGMAILTVGLCYTKDTLCQTDKTHAHSLPLFYMCVCILPREDTYTNKQASTGVHLPSDIHKSTD